jgi:hypothetical protein
MACLAPAPAGAESVTENTAAGAADFPGANEDALGQSFTVPSAVPTDDFLHTLRVEHVTKTTGSFNLFVIAVNGSGLPTGPVLFTSPAINAPLNDSPVEVHPNVEVTPGQQYAFYFEVDGGEGLGGSVGDQYTAGQELIRTSGVWGAGPAGFDMTFRAEFDRGGLTTTSFNCPASATVGVGISCSGSVDNVGGNMDAATGSLALSTLNDPSENFTVCTLNVSADCSSTYTPGTAGSITVFSQYLGDSDHLGSSAPSDVVSVGTRDSATQVSCGSATVSAATTCTATVSDDHTGTASVPTGSVAFSTTGGGSFSAPSCALAGGTCSVSYTPSTVGIDTITAAYGGGARHSASEASSPLGVAAASVTPPSAVPFDCTPLRNKLQRLKGKLRKTDRSKTKTRNKIRKQIRKTRKQLAAQGC